MHASIACLGLRPKQKGIALELFGPGKGSGDMDGLSVVPCCSFAAPNSYRDTYPDMWRAVLEDPILPNGQVMIMHSPEEIRLPSTHASALLNTIPRLSHVLKLPMRVSIFFSIS